MIKSTSLHQDYNRILKQYKKTAEQKSLVKVLVVDTVYLVLWISRAPTDKLTISK
jgi:hypothetical protein